MKKYLGIIINCIVLILLTSTVQVQGSQNNQKVSIDKIWTIELNSEVDERTINDTNIYVLDSKGNREDIEIEITNQNKWIVVSPKEQYKPNETYKLVVTTQVQDYLGNNIKQPKNMTFSTSDKENNKLTLGWSYSYNKEGNKAFYDSKDDIIVNDSINTGLDIVSPIWFELKWKDGQVIGINEKVDKTYIETARKNGYSIWPCFQQMYSGDIASSLGDYGKKLDLFFNDEDAVNKVINELKFYIKEYNFKGLNIDFEGMGKINKDNYTQFVKKLSERLKQEDIIVSVDINEPVLNSAYSECYDRPELSEHVDYVMFMGYDEHWVGDVNAGSVSSYPWVENGINKILNQGVPKEKLILGVPFYMRDFAVVEASPKEDSIMITKRQINGVITKIYSEKSINSIPIKECTYGEIYKVVSIDEKWYEIEYRGKKGYILKQNAQFVQENKTKKIAVGWNVRDSKYIENIINDVSKKYSIYYDEFAKQDVLVYYDYDRSRTAELKHQIWLENEKSMEWRMELAKKYDLAGVAGWSIKFSNKELLNVIRNYNNE